MAINVEQESSGVAASSSRYQVSTTFDNLLQGDPFGGLRYPAVPDQNDGPTLSANGLVAAPGLSAGYYTGLSWDVWPFAKNPEIVTKCRIDNVDTGVDGDDIDFFIGFYGTAVPDDYTGNGLGLKFNAVSNDVVLVMSDGVTAAMSTLTGVSPTAWTTYRVTFDGTTANAYADGVLKATLSTNQPGQATQPFVVGGIVRANSDNLGAFQVPFVVIGLDF